MINYIARMVLKNKLFAIRRILQNSRQFHCSRARRIFEEPQKTIVDIVNKSSDQLLINECVEGGFRMSDNSLVVGPLVIFQTALLSWNVTCGKDINEASLSLFNVLEPPPDILIIGLETTYEYKMIVEIKKLLLKHNIRNEILPVYQACGVYNFLSNEGRYASAALIPLVSETPGTIRLATSMQDVLKTNMKDLM